MAPTNEFNRFNKEAQNSFSSLDGVRKVISDIRDNRYTELALRQFTIILRSGLGDTYRNSVRKILDDNGAKVTDTAMVMNQLLFYFNFEEGVVVPLEKWQALWTALFDSGSIDVVHHSDTDAAV